MSKITSVGNWGSKNNASDKRILKIKKQLLKWHSITKVLCLAMLISFYIFIGIKFEQIKKRELKFKWTKWYFKEEIL